MTERGAISILVIGVMAALIVLGLAVTGAGLVIAARAKAVTAADAAALAAAVSSFPPAARGVGPSAAARAMAAPDCCAPRGAKADAGRNPGGAQAGPIGQLARRERFHWLVAPRSTIIQVSPAHAGRSADLQATLEHLLNTMVRRPS